MAGYGSQDPLILRLRENCELLGQGYDERVEFTMPVGYHNAHCPRTAVTTKITDECNSKCRIVNEKRSRNIRRKGLLEQLQDYQANKDVDRNPKAARGAPRVKTPKMHPELAGFFALDEIVTDIYSTVDQAMADSGRDRTWVAQPTKHILIGLPTQATYLLDRHVDIARHLDRKAAGWVATARRTLKIAVSDSTFRDASCGNCGGFLASPNGNQGESSIRCVGTDDAPPCGHEYPMSDWLSLYEGRS